MDYELNKRRLAACHSNTMRFTGMYDRQTAVVSGRVYLEVERTAATVEDNDLHE